MTGFRVTTFEPKLLRWWCTNREKLDMDPPYQRKARLWSTTDKAFLIDSILNEYDLPKFYVADFTFGGGNIKAAGKPYAIVDGKQRFEAIFDFFDGRLTLDTDFRLESSPELKLAGLGYSDLLKRYPKIAESFDNFCPTVMRIVASDESRINELFVRLNRSKPLTGAEIRNALPGPVPTVLRVLTNHSFFTDYIRFSAKRGADTNAATKILLFEFAQKPVETKKKQLDAFAKAATKDRDAIDKLELATRRAALHLDRLSEIFLPKDSLLSAAGIVPVYYWFIREEPPQKDVAIREFLVDFNRKLKLPQEREVSTDDASTTRRIQFVSLNRSTNDAKSHIERVQILQEEFKAFSQGLK